MTMFGIDITIKNIDDRSTCVDRYIDSALKRNDERKVFKQFLQIKTSKGEDVFEEIVRNSKLKSAELLEKGIEIPNTVLFDFAIASLKSKHVGNLTVYDLITRKIIEDQNPKFVTLHKNIDANKFDGKTPFGYPEASKRAQGVLAAKVKDSLSEVKIDYLEYKLTKEKIEEYSREMFLAVNKFGLKGQSLVNYLQALFYLENIQESEPKGDYLIKSMIAESLKSGVEITAIYPKCLRLVYPNGNRLSLIDDPFDESQLSVIDKGGKEYLLPSESGFKDRAKDLLDTMKALGIKLKLVVLIMDVDIDDLFDNNLNYISNEDIRTASGRINIYKQNLSNHQSGVADVYTLTQFLEVNHLLEKFRSIKQNLYRDLARGNSIVSEKLIEDRVNYRYQGDLRIFGRADRKVAREKVLKQISTEVALQVLLIENTFVISQDRGVENYYTAGIGDKYPVFFSDLAEGNM